MGYYNPESALDLYRKSNGYYIDVHAWFFTPSVFFDLINILFSMGLINLKREIFSPTLKNSNEFWVVMKVDR